MSDWLMSDDSDNGSYLGMDDPAMPDAAPAPPSAPTQATAAPDAADDWLTGSSSGPQDGFSAGAAPVMDGHGDWMSSDQGSTTSAAVIPGSATTQPAGHAMPAQPMAMSHNGEMSVLPPQLQQVQPSRRTLGASSTAAAGELSDLVLDVEVQVEVGLGNAALTVEEFLEMGRGSVVELDTPIDAPIELKVRGKLIARGQLVSINGSYGMRIVEMLNKER